MRQPVVCSFCCAGCVCSVRRMERAMSVHLVEGSCDSSPRRGLSVNGLQGPRKAQRSTARRQSPHIENQMRLETVAGNATFGQRQRPMVIGNHSVPRRWGANGTGDNTTGTGGGKDNATGRMMGQRGAYRQRSSSFAITRSTRMRSVGVAACDVIASGVRPSLKPSMQIPLQAASDCGGLVPEGNPKATADGDLRGSDAIGQGGAHTLGVGQCRSECTQTGADGWCLGCGEGLWKHLFGSTPPAQHGGREHGPPLLVCARGLG